MPKKRTHDEFVSMVDKITIGEYTVLGEYVNSVTNIKMKHNCEDCNNYEFSPTPGNFLFGSRCPICSTEKQASKRRKSTEEFSKEVFDCVGNEYLVLGDYINSKTKLLFKHNKDTCNHQFEMCPNHFIVGQRCPKCFGSPKKTTEEIKQNIQNLVGDEYEMIGDYTNCDTKIKLKHINCNHTYEVLAYHFMQGVRCPNCFGTPKKSHEEFCKEIFDLVGDEYNVVGDYIGRKHKVLMQHVKCGNTWDVDPYSFISGSRCPNCNVFKGENAIKVWCNDNKIKYIPQYKLEGCKDINALRFDFGIIDNNDSLKCLVEYDGQQHFKPVFFGGMSYDKALKSHKDVIRKDNIKNEYCKNNNIYLLRIPHWEFDNINKILNQELLSQSHQQTESQIINL